MQAMIFAAGLGTRLKPLTDRIPKALVSVGGEPLLKRVIFQLKDAGFTRIVVNVHHFSQQIIDYLRAHDNFGMDIRISDESEKLLERVEVSGRHGRSSTSQSLFLSTTWIF